MPTDVSPSNAMHNQIVVTTTAQAINAILIYNMVCRRSIECYTQNNLCRTTGHCEIPAGDKH
jgi:hypothetical protein